ncbi:MAG: dockerin type I repeat-containing protein [Candidatus Zixiibacteriota bacterium]
MFAGRLNKDFRLTNNSPCIDAGNPNPSYNDPDGSRNDIGAIFYEAPIYICGDADGNEMINILDITKIIGFLYKEGPQPDPIEAADANGNGSCNILDVTYLISFLYKSGPEPVCP